MAKKQTRRSVSVRGSTYEKIREYCDIHDKSMSEFVEERIAMFFGNTSSGNGRFRDQEAGKKSSGEQRSGVRYARLEEDAIKDADRFFTF